MKHVITKREAALLAAQIARDIRKGATFPGVTLGSYQNTSKISFELIGPGWRVQAWGHGGGYISRTEIDDREAFARFAAEHAEGHRAETVKAKLIGA